MPTRKSKRLRDERPKLGRPRVPEGEARTERVVAHLRVADFRKLERRAKKQGVRIGQDSVVGTGAVVTEDVPRGSVVAGNPARVVRSLEENDRRSTTNE